MFVGRQRELSTLLAVVESAAAGRGGTIFLSGEAGMGKRALVDELDRLTGDGIAFLTGTCQREHEGQNAYEPFAEILVRLVETSGGEKAKRALVEVLKETAPDWLSMIPVVGAGVAAGVKTALRVREVYRDEEREERERLAQDRALQFLGALSARLEDGPVALVIEQAQWIDGPSSNLLERVARFAAKNAVAVIVLSRPDEVGPDHPLRAVEDELVIEDLAQHVDLGGLDAAGVSAFAQAEGGWGLAPDVAGWLREFTDGSPLFVAHLLPVLEDSGILVQQGDALVFHDDASADGGSLTLTGRLAGITLPPSVKRAVERRIAQLDESDRDLLEIASVEGRRFLSSTLAQVAEVEERSLVRTLGDVEKSYGLIRAEPVLRRRQYAYEFAHLLLQQQMYAELSEPERVEYHCAVAEALVKTFGEHPPRPVLLDIARHYELGLDGVAAAGWYLLAAQSAVLDGASPQCVALCRRGLGLEPDDRTRAELTHLLVTASDIAWTGASDMEQLLAHGQAAAARVADKELQARLLAAEGNLLVWSRDVQQARAKLEQAVAVAREAEEAGEEGAALTRLAIMIDLGNTTDVQSLAEGLAVLEEARKLYESELAGQTDPAVQRLYLRLQGFIGVGEFDRGNLGRARELLDASVNGLVALGMRSDLPRLLNYRAQVALARGDFAAAEADLGTALDGAEPGAWTSYNTALLGKIYLDSERYDDAGPLIRQAWAGFREHWRLSLGIVARAYLIEFLLRPGSSAAEVEEAGPLVDEEIRQATEGGYGYCVIWAESLAAVLALRRGDPASGVEHGRTAVSLLDASGDLPIVRTEEVLRRCAEALEAAGSDEAAVIRERARVVLGRKAGTLPGAEAAVMREVTPTARALR